MIFQIFEAVVAPKRLSLGKKILSYNGLKLCWNKRESFNTLF